MARLVPPLVAWLLAMSCAVPAGAADSRVTLMVDGRPLTRTVALERSGVAYVDVASVVRTFSGLVSFDRRAATVSVGNRVAIFSVGSPKANVDGHMVGTGGTTFVSNGDTFVPLAFFVTRVAGGSIRMNGATALISSRSNR